MSSSHQAEMLDQIVRGGLLEDWPRGRDLFSFFDCQETHSVAAVVPMSGIAGIWGPSCISAAQLAVSEVNARGGIAGRQLKVLFLDSNASGITDVSRTLATLVGQRAVSGVISMGVSDVRRTLNRAIGGRVPHVFTPPYDGRECSADVFTIGATPNEQLAPASRVLVDGLRARRWAIVGRNYVRSPLSNAIAKSFIADAGGKVVFEQFVPFGLEDPSELIDGLAAAKPDIVFVSLIGQDAVNFNRAFGDAGLHRSMFRFSELAEESTLLASGGDNTKGLFCVSSYFETLDTDVHLAFQQRYDAIHETTAPVPNVIGQSIYEGISFYVSLVDRRSRGLGGPITYPSARGGVFHSNRAKEDPIYLAQADGVRFSDAVQIAGPNRSASGLLRFA